ncbi:CDP-glucose 4,6-dehydratase/UDP-glucuronate 4-epimerase [Abditibacterium utsteinense]|uniref:CDP-glucose 4,6-dehydratase/UDP-glucuronate 4-epimerase n=1 Tax=Abditibacterium utsteinense TaxID=1960156 RepID=A0A2S8SW66_9BACT|nr:NAD(P)-dependent oxidoreductase [Abditibacterium utsteinense]PQV65009.1 CDP-glucose 4,6-dehydratase/UDP-glucuronate 4-epimerase [Abditibacterium utsteinense]
MNWKNQSALVVGASGFCGAHLCDQLTQKGARVIGLDKFLPPDSWLHASGAFQKIHFISGDILDLPNLKLILQRFPVDVIFLLAAQPIAPISNQLPLETAQINIMGTVHVLEAMRALKAAPKLVFASSGAVYGATDAKCAIPEDAPSLVAGNIYAPTKAAADLMVRCYAQIYGLRTATCRWMNTYGPGDTNFSRIIPRSMQRFSKGETALIDGTDGKNILEMLHVRDMIDAYLRVAERLDDSEVRGEAFNFGGGAPLELRFVVREAARAWNRVSSASIEENPTVTGPKTDSVKYLDISKAQRVLGWKPRIPFFDGLDETALWYSRYFAAQALL